MEFKKITIDNHYDEYSKTRTYLLIESDDLLNDEFAAFVGALEEARLELALEIIVSYRNPYVRKYSCPSLFDY